MPPPPLPAATGSRSTTVSDESTQAQDESPVYSFSDPTFEETARRLRLGIGDWTLKGPRFADGTQPTIHVDHRLGELILRTLLDRGEQTLSRKQREKFQQGDPLERIRLVKKTTPIAGTNANQNCDEGYTENTIH